uniref:Apolipoprotein M n=1 Tax=Cyprinodon variegatus TaxID=28743 RepID=A0A3Q2EHY2_CYPVA
MLHNILSPILYLASPERAHLSHPHRNIHLTSIQLLTMFAQFCFAFLAISSLAAASDQGCDELIKPLEDRSKVYGKWITYAIASDSEENLKAYAISTSSWAKMSPIPDSDEFTIHYVDRIEGKCVHGTANSSTSGNTTTVVFHFNSTDYECVGRYLKTCAECVLWSDEQMKEFDGKVKKTNNLVLFTKTGKLDESDKEIFKKQAKCLNLLPDFYFSETTDLCPEQSEPTTAPTDTN